MRGEPERQMAMLTTLSPEDLIPADHRIRRIRKVVEEVLASLDAEFEAMYSRIGRPSVPPGQLLKATVLMALYSMRSERAFCERLNYDLLFKWFLDLPIDAAAFDPTTFTKNRERLLDHEIADRFFAAVVRQATLRRYLSSEHFSVDGTLLEAWASHKSFKPKDGSPPPTVSGGRNGELDFRGQPRSNKTLSSTTDPEALLARKSDAAPAKLCYAGHVLMENRSALIVDMELTQADGRAERGRASDARTAPRTEATTHRGRGQGLRHRGLRRLLPHPRHHRPRGPEHVQPTQRHRRSHHRHTGHQISQRIRKRIEEPFGWIKTIGGGRKLRYKGRSRNRAWFLIAGAVYNVLRIAALDAQAP